MIIISTTTAHNTVGASPGYYYRSDEIKFDKPEGVEDGDMLVMVVGVYGTQGYVQSTGWITGQNPDHGSPDRQVRLLYRVITSAAGEPETYTFDTKDPVWMQGIMICLRGADITTPTFLRQGQGDDEPVGKNGQCPSVTTTFDGALILACMVVCYYGSPSDYWGSVRGNPAPTHLIDEPAWHSASTDHNYVKLGVAYAQQIYAGTTSGYSWYIPSTGNFRQGAEMAMTVAIKPDPNYVPPAPPVKYKNIDVLFDGAYYPFNYNPVHAIWQCLKIVGLSESWLDPTSFLAAAITVHSEQIGVSVLMRNHQSCLVYIKSLLAHINGIIYYGIDSKLHIRLIRDDYNIETLPTVGIEELLAEPDFERGSWMETIGEVQIQFNQITSPKTDD